MKKILLALAVVAASSSSAFAIDQSVSSYLNWSASDDQAYRYTHSDFTVTDANVYVQDGRVMIDIEGDVRTKVISYISNVHTTSNGTFSATQDHGEVRLNFGGVIATDNFVYSGVTQELLRR